MGLFILNFFLNYKHLPDRLCLNQMQRMHFLTFRTLIFAQFKYLNILLKVAVAPDAADISESTIAVINTTFFLFVRHHNWRKICQ